MAEETWIAMGLVFTGAGVLTGGCAGILLPKERRLGVLYSLVAGAGVGVIVLAVGTVIGTYEPSLFMFFLGGFLGFLAVCLGVWFVATSHRWER